MMKKIRRPDRAALLRWLLLLLPLLLSGACAPQDLVVSPLGTVVVGPGEAIQIRSLEALTGVGDLGIPRQRAVAMALADYGPIKGYEVSMGAGVDTLCTAEGGLGAAETVVGDGRVVGVIGTTCSVAAAVASPILSEAGLVMISASNTAPSLTSDLRGKAGAHYRPGYYRTAGNDLYMGQAVADFVYNELGLRRMAAIHDGDPYTSGLTGAFAAAFEALGGAVTGVAQIGRGDTDMIPALTGIAADGPEGLFFPVFPDESGHIARQVGQVDGLEGVTLIGSDSLLLGAPEAVGVYIAGPDLRFGNNINEATGKSHEQLIADYQARHQGAPTTPYLAHAYDAATLLLGAIEEAAVVAGGRLYIDRARLREALTNTTGFQGITGVLSCDGFGDCGSGRASIAHHTDPAVTEFTELPVVYRYSP